MPKIIQESHQSKEFSVYIGIYNWNKKKKEELYSFCKLWIVIVVDKDIGVNRSSVFFVA